MCCEHERSQQNGCRAARRALAAGASRGRGRGASALYPTSFQSIYQSINKMLIHADSAGSVQSSALRPGRRPGRELTTPTFLSINQLKYEYEWIQLDRCRAASRALTAGAGCSWLAGARARYTSIN